MITRTQGVARYARYFETLSPDRLADLKHYCTEDVLFVDPFNRVRGVDSMAAIFWHMYENTDDPAFKVHDWSISGHAAYIFWHFSCRTLGKTIEFDGVSRLLVGEDGKVSEHVDYWDSAGAIWFKVPVIGWVLRLLARRLTLKE